MNRLLLVLTVALAACAPPSTGPSPEAPKSVSKSGLYGVNFGKQKNAITLAAGNNNDVDIDGNTGNTSTLIRFTPDNAGSTVTGMDASTVADGDLFFIRNEHASASLTLTHQDSLSIAANRFTTANGAALVIPPRTGAMVWYDPTLGFNVFVVASGSPTLSTLKVGASGTALTQVRVYTSSITPVATAAAIGTTAQTFTVTGLTTADTVYVNVPGITALCPVVAARVSAADTLQLWFATLTAAACTPAAGNHVVVAVRS